MKTPNGNFYCNSCYFLSYRRILHEVRKIAWRSALPCPFITYWSRLVKLLCLFFRCSLLPLCSELSTMRWRGRTRWRFSSLWLCSWLGYTVSLGSCRLLLCVVFCDILFSGLLVRRFETSDPLWEGLWRLISGLLDMESLLLQLRFWSLLSFLFCTKYYAYGCESTLDNIVFFDYINNWKFNIRNKQNRHFCSSFLS